MNTRNTQLDLPPGDEASDGDAARPNGDFAPPEPAAAEPESQAPPDPPPVEAPPRPAEPPPPLADLAPPGPPAWHDFPVASVLPPVAPLLPSAPPPAVLEDRLRRLEAELSQLRMQPAAEARPAAPPPDQGVSVARPRGNFWGGLGKRLLAPSGPSAAPPPRTEGFASMVPAHVRHTWLLFDALTQLRAIYWMFFDPRYRLSWLARLAPVVILALILTSGFWTPGVGLPFIGPVLDKLVDLVLAYVLFKLLSHEARRYRETAPDLPAGLRQ